MSDPGNPILVTSLPISIIYRVSIKYLICYGYPVLVTSLPISIIDCISIKHLICYGYHCVPNCDHHQVLVPCQLSAGHPGVVIYQIVIFRRSACCYVVPFSAPGFMIAIRPTSLCVVVHQTVILGRSASCYVVPVFCPSFLLRFFHPI